MEGIMVVKTGTTTKTTSNNTTKTTSNEQKLKEVGRRV
jgi:hypothetical protein